MLDIAEKNKNKLDGDLKLKEECKKIHENITVTMQRLDNCEGIIANNRLGSQVNALGNSREVTSFLH